MSPGEALASPVFQFYAAASAGVLGSAGVLLSVLRYGFQKDVRHAWNAYRGWLFMVPIALGSIFAGRETVIVSLTAVAIFGFKEFAQSTGLYRDWIITGTVYLGIVAVGVVSLVKDPSSGTPGWYGLFMALPVFIIAAILIIPIARNSVSGQLQSLALSIAGFVYFGWMFGHLAFMSNARNAYGYLLYLVFAVELSDVAAYTTGRLFGRHPLRSNISPKKTWEGSMGALAVSLVLPWAAHFTLPQFQAKECVLAGLIVGVGGQLGDLAISVIKRDLGIKDMGAAIPGHGGVLDRIDSLIYTAPLFFHMTRYFHGL
jgi:phosphatidate cytidylyltransferase